MRDELEAVESELVRTNGWVGCWSRGGKRRRRAESKKKVLAASSSSPVSSFFRCPKQSD